MLPDDPALKEVLLSAVNRLLQQRVLHHLNILSEMPRQQLFEGTGSTIRRPDGRVDNYPTREISSEFSIRTPEIPTFTLANLLLRIDEIAIDFARQQSEQTFQLIGEATERVGNVVNSGGKPLTAEIILQALGTMEIDFDHNGKHKPITIVIPPQLQEGATAAMELLTTDQRVQAEHRDLMERKREEWRAREASRKLVG